MTTAEQHPVILPGEPGWRPGAGLSAAFSAIEASTLRVDLPFGLGEMTLPSPERLAWYGGIAAVAALGLVDWPVAAVLAAGHLLSENHHNKLLKDFGQALEEA